MRVTRSVTRFAKYAVIVFLSVTIVTLFVISQLGTMWHWLHGDTVLYLGWRIPVPGKFYVVRQGQVPSMWKTDFGIPYWGASYGHIAFRELTRPFDLEKDYDTFSQGAFRNAREHAFSLRKERGFPIDQAKAHCLEFSGNRKKRSMTEVQCVVEQSELWILYEGSEKYLPAFYAALRGMSRAAASE